MKSKNRLTPAQVLREFALSLPEAHEHEKHEHFFAPKKLVKQFDDR
jgi:hypothetical protein